MVVLIYVVSLLAFWGVFTAKAGDNTTYYTFNITDGFATPLGTPHPVILINGQFPGPTINCVTNEIIVVNVFNKLKVPFLLTWNGIQQRKSSWQDGVLGTNCPILPNQNWTYQLRIKDQIGAYTYFPSVGMQKAVSYGAFNVWPRKVIQVPYSPPAENVSLLIGDWYTQNYTEMAKIVESGSGGITPIALLINGQASYDFTGDQGKEYMFRISNVALSTSFNFRIQDHMLKLVEVGGAHVEKKMLESLDIYVGQTMTVIVNLTRPSNASYYIVASSTFSDTTLNVTGILRYTNSTAGLRPVKPMSTAMTSNVSWSMQEAKSIKWNLTASAARPNPQGSYHYYEINITRTIVLENSARNVSGTQRYYLNHISYINPDTPLKLADFLHLPGIYNSTFPGNDSKTDVYKQGTEVLPASLHDFHQIVFQNNGPALEVYHFDGHDFWLVGMGSGLWTSSSWNGSDAYNLHDALSIHTVQVYPNSWTAIYVKLDNEGMWNLRSALWQRQYLGQQLYVRVNNTRPDPRMPTEYRIPDNAIFCGIAKK